jgi:hypothetical protein
MDSAGMRKRRVGVTAGSRWIVEDRATGSPQIVPEIAAPLELRTPMGTVATATNRVRMEARRQGRGSQQAEDNSKEMVENEGRDRLVGSAPEARLRRCLKLRQGASPLRPPAPFPSGSRFWNGRNLSRVRKPRRNRAPLTDSFRSEESTGMRERGPLEAGVSPRLPLVGPERHRNVASSKP